MRSLSRGLYAIKKSVSVLLVLVMVATVSLFGCNSSAKAADTKMPKQLKILAVGNSLSFNTLYYVYDMAESLGIEEVVVGNIYIGSCSIKRHWNNARSNKKAYTYFKNTNGKWKKKGRISISKALADEDWDYVMFSQYSGDAGKPETYKHLNSLLKYVRKRVDKDTKFIWNIMWAYQDDYEETRFAYYDYDQKTMYNEIIKATKKKIVNNHRISIINPSGTAVQNARTSSFGDTFTRDGRHLTEDGRYIAGMTLTSKILGISPSKIKYRPRGVTKKMRKLAVKSVSRALSKPYKISAF